MKILLWLAVSILAWLAVWFVEVKTAVTIIHFWVIAMAVVSTIILLLHLLIIVAEHYRLATRWSALAKEMEARKRNGG